MEFVSGRNVIIVCVSGITALQFENAQNQSNLLRKP